MTVDVPRTLQTIRSELGLTQAQLAEQLGVTFATVNRWEGGGNTPQRAALEKIMALADTVDSGESIPAVSSTRKGHDASTTKPMEQMLWDAACSIRGEKDASKFKDYLLPLLFLKRLSDVFDDEIARLADEFGDHDMALEVAEQDPKLLRFWLPPEARWAVISGRESYEWPDDEKGHSTKPKDIGQHLTKAVRAVARHNPTLAGVIDVVDFAAERNGERDINPAKLRGVVEKFSDPRYRLGLADVQPDFLGRAYEYLLRKFAEGSGQSAGEFFTPTEVGYLMARILKPRPGQSAHDFACGSGGLLVKLQLIARELDPASNKVPLKLSGQELGAESFAVAKMNTIIHDLEVDLQRGDTMINPKFRDKNANLQKFDLVVANPMWNQPFDADIFENDPYSRFSSSGGVTTGKGDWAWLQHTLSILSETGRAAVVLDTGAVTRGSGSKGEDKERNIRKWFVEQDLIEGVILLPENLFYNTTASGIIVVINKRKPVTRKGKIALLNASKRSKKGKPKNYLVADELAELAKLFNSDNEVPGEFTIITTEQAREADYNLSPARWVTQAETAKHRPIKEIWADLQALDSQAAEIDKALAEMLVAL